jgi:hypothetical protein
MCSAPTLVPILRASRAKLGNGWAEAIRADDLCPTRQQRAGPGDGMPGR